MAMVMAIDCGDGDGDGRTDCAPGLSDSQATHLRASGLLDRRQVSHFQEPGGGANFANREFSWGTFCSSTAASGTFSALSGAFSTASGTFSEDVSAGVAAASAAGAAAGDSAGACTMWWW